MNWIVRRSFDHWTPVDRSVSRNYCDVMCCRFTNTIKNLHLSLYWHFAKSLSVKLFDACTLERWKVSISSGGSRTFVQFFLTLSQRVLVVECTYFIYLNLMNKKVRDFSEVRVRGRRERKKAGHGKSHESWLQIRSFNGEYRINNAMNYDSYFSFIHFPFPARCRWRWERGQHTPYK